MIDDQTSNAGGSAVKRIFISYSHKDAQWLDRLRVHLRPLERAALIEIWDDRKLKPGIRGKEAIRAAVQKADVAVLLVTADFLASDFIAAEELPPLLRSAEKDGAMILAVILKPSLFESTPSLSCYQALPDPARPLISLSDADQEHVFLQLAEHIRTSTTRIRSSAAMEANAKAALLSAEHARSPEAIQLIENARSVSLGSAASTLDAPVRWKKSQIGFVPKTRRYSSLGHRFVACSRIRTMAAQFKRFYNRRRAPECR